MADSMGIAEYEGRIAAALDRIAGAVDRLTVPQAVADDGIAALREALEAERATSAQLAERLNAVKSARDALRESVGALIAEGEALRARVAELEPVAENLAAMTAARDADRAEVAAVLAALAPLVEEAAHA